MVTLEELVHMRRVLTAASLDNLPLDSSIKDDVTNGKVGTLLILNCFFLVHNSQETDRREKT